jgi:hypothetical protein
MTKTIDAGHEALLSDLKDILKQAEAFEFHDFENSNYATPKFALDRCLENIRNFNKGGKYDN